VLLVLQEQVQLQELPEHQVQQELQVQQVPLVLVV